MSKLQTQADELKEIESLVLQLASADSTIKDLQKKLRVAGRSNTHIMEYVEELEGKL
jgi:hypothetical protein